MMSVKFDDRVFFKDLMNIVKYSEGFLEGVQSGKKALLESLGKNSVEIFKEFVDQQARVDEQMYHHIYEWYQTGSPQSRLFDVEYVANDGGLSFSGTFSQSRSVKNGSKTPFYNKAQVMERGLPITISPVNSSVLTFNVGGEQVFTKNPVTIQHPGGSHVMGAFENIFDIFFKQHFKQSVLDATGITRYLGNPIAYKNNFKAGKSGGKAKGLEVGYNWIAKAGDLSV